MKKLFFVFYVLLASFARGQEITNLVLVGPGGITEDPSKATSFIVVKHYPDNHLERLDYKKGGPMSLLRSYKDSNLTILEGRYFKYKLDGGIQLSGQYLNNQKEGRWLAFNDTGGVSRTIEYDHDTIVIQNESLSNDRTISYPDEKEASFPGGVKAWQEYLVKSLEESRTADKALTGGKVYVSFRIDPKGNVQDVFISKSVEFIIDEESIDIIKKSPKWNAAFQNGRNVNAYRRQPVTFLVD